VAWSKGFFASRGDYDYALALFAASLALVFSGAGRWSADRRLGAAR
jgi:putative oxidoreductase